MECSSNRQILTLLQSNYWMTYFSVRTRMKAPPRTPVLFIINIFHRIDSFFFISNASPLSQVERHFSTAKPNRKWAPAHRPTAAARRIAIALRWCFSFRASQISVRCNYAIRPRMECMNMDWISLSYFRCWSALEWICAALESTPGLWTPETGILWSCCWPEWSSRRL